VELVPFDEELPRRLVPYPTAQRRSFSTRHFVLVSFSSDDEDPAEPEAARGFSGRRVSFLPPEEARSVESFLSEASELVPPPPSLPIWCCCPLLWGHRARS
jgi:hypothetical protein